MPDSFTNLVYHIIFATKDRKPTLRPEHQSRIYGFIGGTIRRLGGSAVCINGMEDHIHLLAILRPDHHLSGVVRDIKSTSTVWMRRELNGMEKFSWQRGFGAFTVSQSSISKVANYISTQKEHHKKRSCHDELILLLKQHNIRFDMKYI